MKLLLTRFVFVLGLATSLCGAEIKVLLNPENQNVSDALIIVFPKKVTVTKGQTTLKYRILNRSSEDIFVVIKSENVESVDLKGPSGNMAGGAMFVGKECTHESLRLLYSPNRESDGTLRNGEDGMVSGTDAEVNVDAGHERDLSYWIGGTGTLRLQIKYSVSNSKNRRSVVLSVPVEIVEGEQAAASEGDKPAK
jgi:hypothetical protein